MKRFFRFVLWSLLLVITLVIAATFIFEDRIGRLVLDQVNRQFGTTIEAQRFGLSLLRHFPAVGGELEGVRVAGAFGEPLLEAETAGFELPYSVLWGGEVALRTLYLEDCTLRIVVDDRGRGNYDILPTTKGTDATGARFGIERARLDNVRFRYENAALDQYADIQVLDGEVSGEFGAADFILRSDARLRSREVRLDGTRYLLDKSIDYATKLAVDTEVGTYLLKDTRVAVEDNAFLVNGEVTQADEHTLFDLEFESEEAELGKVLRLLPPPYSDYLNDIESDGRFVVNGVVDGRLSATEQPAIAVNLDLSDGELGTSLFATDLSDIAFRAAYTNGDLRRARTAKLTVDNFTGRIGDERIEMELAVQNFDDPYFNLRVSGAADIAPLRELIELPHLSAAGGVLKVPDLKIKGRYARLLDPDRIDGVEIAGILEADALQVVYNDKPLGVKSGRLLLDGNRMTLDALRLTGEESDLLLRGTVDNVLPVLLADSLNSRGAALALDLTAEARYLDLESLFHLTDVTEAEADALVAKGEAQVAVNAARRSRLTNLLRGKVAAQVAAFSYGRIEGEDFEGAVTFKQDRLLLRGDAAGMDGRYTLDGTLDFTRAPHLRAQVKGIGVDAHQLFTQAENFGQTFLEAKHLDGTLNGYTIVDAYWDAAGIFRLDDLKVSAGLGIVDGNLNDFPLLENFEDYIDRDALRDVHFDDLNGFFEIRRGEVRICKTQIRTNAANLVVSGRHDFDQQFNYYIRVNAGQVLANKLFRNGNTDDPLKERNGLINLHYVVEGDVDDFDYERNKSRVKNDFDTSVNVQRRVVKALQQAFPEIQLSRPGTVAQNRSRLPAERDAAKAAPVPPAPADGNDEYIDFELRPGGR